MEYIQTDVWVRYWRLRERDVVYFCADDTHGTPVMMRAWTEGTTPEELILRMAREHLRDFTAFGVSFDLFYSTHTPENRELSEEIFTALQKNGHIATREIEQAWLGSDRRAPRCRPGRRRHGNY